MVIDGEKKERSLFRIVKDTLTPERRSNSVIACFFAYLHGCGWVW